MSVLVALPLKTTLRRISFAKIKIFFLKSAKDFVLFVVYNYITYKPCIDTIAACVTKGQSKLVKAGVGLSLGLSDIYSNSARDVSNGDTWRTALRNNTREFLTLESLEYALDKAIFPHFTDFARVSTYLLFPSEE